MQKYLLFKLSIREGNKVHLSDFRSGMVIHVRQTALNISETAYLLGFSHTTIAGVYMNGLKMRKYPLRSNSLDKNALMMPEVRRSFLDW